MRPILRKLCAALLGLGAILLVLEVGTRVYVTRFADEATFKRYASLRDLAAHDDSGSFVQRHWYLGYVLTPGWENKANRHNKLGYRGKDFPQRKPDKEYRIACLGGSTTYGTGINDFEEAYPAVLESHLHRLKHGNVRVVNAGVQGYSTFETLFNLHLRILDLSPDAIVIYHGVNDLKCRIVWPPETYVGDNSGYRGLATTFLMPPIIEHSALARVVMTKMDWMTPHADLDRVLGEPKTSAVWGDYRIQLKKGLYPSKVFRRVRVAEILRRNPPVFFARNLRHIVRLAQDNGVTPVLATFASRSASLTESAEFAAEFDAAIAEMNMVVRKVAETTGAHLIDFAAHMELDERFFLDEVHLSAEGAGVQGALFARYFDEVLFPGAR